jgi:galacturonosyltransferase
MADKIVVIGNNSGGMYGFRKELIERLVADANEVTVLTPFDDMVEELKNLGIKLIETPIDRRGMNPVTDFGLFLQYKKILKDENPDIIITYTIKPNIYAGIVSRWMHVPLAANITGLGSAFQSQGLLRKVVTILYKISLRKAKVVFFENEENRQIFIRENIVSEKQTCLLMGAGVNVEHYKPTPYPNGTVTKFLFIGRVMKEKGIDELLKVMEKLVANGMDVELDVLGNYEENYRLKIEQYRSEGWLHYHGVQKDVRPFIAESHCFVLPSWHEGMANTNLECAASGRPVITSNIHGCLEAVEDGVSGYLCERQNADDLYRVMKKFTELSYEERKAMGLAGRKRMEEMFDKKKVVEETVKQLFSA